MNFLYPERPKLININQPLFEKLSNDPKWVAEPKYNGNRLVLMTDKDKDDVQFWNRHGEKFSYTPNKDLVDALEDFLKETKGQCMFDGELRHNKVLGIKHRIVLWDVFVWDGELQVGKTYHERRGLLPRTELWEEHPCLSSPIVQCTSNFKYFFDLHTKDPEIEGFVIKSHDGKLNLSRTAGQDSNWMVKVRRPSNSYRF